MGIAVRWVPSSLYTFPFQGFARDCHLKGFPEFDTSSPHCFQRGLQFKTTNQVLYQLSYSGLETG